jgi:GMP synthase (glutamine-hydrolysing)
MILIISTCKEKLSELEFVRPIEEILEKYSYTKHYTKIKKEDLEKAEKIIICGTALKDFKYLEDIKMFEWIRETKKPILGICSGAQIITLMFEGKLKDEARIGVHKVEMEEKKFDAYFLNTKTIDPEKEFLVTGKTDGIKCIIKHKEKEITGILFHPEVLNKGIITNFVSQ